MEALNPNEIALALAAADEVADRHQRVGRAAELAVERARYEADRAERAFHAVEPENRLVARTLETRWEAKLAALAEAEQALAAARDTLPPLPGRAELEKLAADLPGLWHAPTTSHKDRKRLLRTVIADITLLPEPDQHKARIGIRWHTGATDEITVARAVHPGTAKRSPSPAVAMVTRLGPTTATAELADLLNAAGLTTGTGAPVRRQSRPVDPPRLPRPRPEPLRRRRDQRRRRRRTARHQHRRRLRLDQDRQTRRPTRPRQPTLHPLDRPRRGRMPMPHNRIRRTSTRQPGTPHPALAPEHSHHVGAVGIMYSATKADQRVPAPHESDPYTRLQEGQYETSVPNVADRIAQTAAAMLLEEKLEPIFHPDSYGYRPGRSAHDALAVTRRRCWKQDWVLDLDVRTFFDSVPHDLLLKAVAHHTDEPWVLLYMRAVAHAPLQHADGTLTARDRGTPQGSPVSPVAGQRVHALRVRCLDGSGVPGPSGSSVMPTYVEFDISRLMPTGGLCRPRRERAGRRGGDGWLVGIIRGCRRGQMLSRNARRASGAR